MPLKTGGGNKLQWYNSNNGEYIKANSITNINEDSMLRLHNYNTGIETVDTVYFPKYGIHSDEYCRHFISKFKDHIYKDPESIPFDKCKYLLTFSEKNDKSLFLNSMGFYDNVVLYLALGDSVDFTNSTFDKNGKYGLSISVKTELYSSDKTYRKTVDTIWIVDENLRARFITMIIGGKKYGNK